jgi:DNA-binding MarR family transcriptional regulator
MYVPRNDRATSPLTFLVMATRWLNDDEMRAWRNYIATVSAVGQALEADMQPHGLTMGDYEVLVYLSEAEDSRMRMCDLAVNLRLSPSGLTRRLDGLVRSGLVERKSCAADRRVMYAQITDRGLEVMRRAAPDHVDGVRRHLIDLLSPQQIQQMGDIFEIVRAAGLARQTA